MNTLNGLGASLLVAMLFSHPVLAFDVPAQRNRNVLNPADTVQSLADWDEITGAVGELTEQVHATARVAKDVAGHPLDEYWSRYVWLPEKRERLEALREKARQQQAIGDMQGLSATLAEAAPLLNAEKYKVAVLMAFGTASHALVYHRNALQPWVSRGTDADRAAVDAELQAGQSALASSLIDVVQMTSYDVRHLYDLTRGVGAPIQALNGHRSRLVAEQSALPNPIALSKVKRTVSCPPPVEPSAARESAGLAEDFPSTEDFYPQDANAARLEGDVTVRVEISRTGCVLSAEVTGTSGARDLDQGALDLAMAGRYVPASVAGKAKAGELTYRIRFETRK